MERIPVSARLRSHGGQHLFERHPLVLRACAGTVLALIAACEAPVTSGGSTGYAGTPAPVAPQGSVAGTGAAPVTQLPVSTAAGTTANVPAAQQPDATGSETLPCEVGKVVAAKCQNCHGAEPIGGAPMPLVKQSDFTAMMTSGRTLPGQSASVGQLVKMRINDAAAPMPGGGLLPDPERTMLTAWLDSGAPHGTAADASCAVAVAPTPVENAPATDPGVLQPDGTRCYTFYNHGKAEPNDPTPYSQAPGEGYVEFFYTAPWTEESELVRFRTLYDNQKILHHWLFYSTVGNAMDGAIVPSIGTHLGDAAQLIAGWAVGGSDVQMPEDVALRMPAPGAGLMVEYHFYNTGVVAENDRTGIEFCVAPKGSRKNLAGMTWLGTENFNGVLGMPAKVMSSYGGTCRPSRAGMNATDPIHIFQFWPHMHKLGRNMKTVVNRVSGLQEEVFNKPFDFNYQIAYPATVDLMPGDTITSTCDFMNTTNASVAFGPSTTQEMCYQFAYSFPAAALDNGVPSLVGASNTCW